MSLRLVGTNHARFGADPDSRIRPELVDYWTDRIGPYGFGVEPDRYLNGNRNSIDRMSQRVIGSLGGVSSDGGVSDGGLSIGGLPIGGLPDGGSLDLVIAAHATPDCDPMVSFTGSYAHTYDDGALVFAVSDQGRLAPFSALRLASAYPEHRNILVIALDQSSVVSADPGLARLDTNTDHAVGLRLTRAGADDAGVVGARLELLPTLNEVASDRVAEAVLGALEPWAPELVITGTDVGPVPGLPVRPAPSDQLCTAVWSVLAAELAEPAVSSAPASWAPASSGPASRRIAVVEYEPDLCCLCLAVVDIPASRPEE